MTFSRHVFYFMSTQFRVIGILAGLIVANSASAQLSRQERETANLASRVTIEGKGILLSEAIQELQKQSKNSVSDLRDPESSLSRNPRLDLNIHDRGFFEAIETITRKAGVAVTFATGDGSIGIIDGPPPPNSIAATSGPFLLTLKRISISRDFQTGISSARLQVEFAWEPRLRPMLLTMKSDDSEIIDDQGRPVAPQVSHESTEVVLRPETPIAELNLALAAPARDAKRLASIQLRADVAIPADIKTFRFSTLAKPNQQSMDGQVRVTLKRIEVEENVWKVDLTVDHSGGGPVLESFRQGLLKNRVRLQRADGSTFEPTGDSANTASTDGLFEFEYLFTDLPGKPAEYELVVETPSRILKIPVEARFSDISLP
jgi:hypothetical protein